MNKRGLTIFASLFITGFYYVIVLYLFFAVLKINALPNFGIAIMFEVVGFVILAYFVLQGVCLKTIKTGYYVPLVIATTIYTIMLNTINMAWITMIATRFFVLLHMVLLFVYCLIAVPMLIMGKK